MTYAAEIEVRFGESVVASRVDVAKRYAALKLPGVDPRFSSPPQFVDPAEPVGLDNL